MSGSRSSRLLLLAALWLVTALVAPWLGSQSVSWSQVAAGEPLATTILFQLRLPRVLLALVAGGALALAGLAFQTLFRNPLAEPYTLGVASGGALGATLVFTFADALGSTPLPLVGAAGFAGSLAATFLVLTLGRDETGGSDRLLLSGVAIALFCQALILFLQYLSDATETLRMVRWMMGGLGVVGYREVLWLTPWSALLLVALVVRRRELDLLLTGEEIAAGRGVAPVAIRWQLLVAASLAVGALVAVAGPIGFIGLVVPHLLRRWLGAEHRILVPAALLGGGIFLALCDLAARTVLAPAELPVGIVSALLGGPFFLWVLRQRRLGV